MNGSCGMTVITGVHRSGTSAVSMMLEDLGLDFGEHAAFYGADQWNELGYFERTDVIDLNSRLLTGFRRTRGRISPVLSQIGYGLLPSPRAVKRRAASLESEVSELARKLDGLAVKDPRFCLTLPAWQPYVASLVVCLRHPAAVAQSLRRRQHIPRSVAFRFWDHHASALLEAPVDTALFIDFDALGGGGAEYELARAIEFLGLGVGIDEALRVFRQRFAPSLRHFGPDQVGILPHRTRVLWEALQARRG